MSSGIDDLTTDQVEDIIHNRSCSRIFVKDISLPHSRYERSKIPKGTSGYSNCTRQAHLEYALYLGYREKVDNYLIDPGKGVDP
jgi:hypothetical protein